MKCPIAKCPLNDVLKCDQISDCQREAWSTIRRAQRLIREVSELMAKHGYSEQYRRWIIRAVAIGAMKKEKR